ncbi:uncharacterized protein LOC100274796 [Zea mays]|jgi:hypothetical protein|uniref:Uncharacterized protein n=1 Tax=Zea mays TaxID=4577 RepID=B6SJD5_MAIZE|nr:uncharacterized protein LOC100274796 [Zea mays]ACG24968.1 hypothetical protein [Zea mays]ONM55254.1 hypothetical protein ZEAMMB73_Zm00001d020610 [Zea mays]|eukprot:NP_001142546.1 uncharacterized protein LOC100274796 [Zea mays]
MELLGLVPAEAIALRLYSLPAAAAAAGSLYAWLVAALAAAIGLWRIRAVSVSNINKRDAGVSALVDDNQEPLVPLLPSRGAAITDEPPAAEPSSVSEPSTPSKVRFTAYYGGSGDEDGVVDGVRKCADDDDVDDGARGRDCAVEVVLRRTVSEPGTRRAAALATGPWEGREMAVRRRSDLGWYRHIDMAALDGSVVRLWDGDLTASPRGRMRRSGLELQLPL